MVPYHKAAALPAQFAKIVRARAEDETMAFNESAVIELDTQVGVVAIVVEEFRRRNLRPRRRSEERCCRVRA